MGVDGPRSFQVEPGQMKWQFGHHAASQVAILLGTVATSSFIPTWTETCFGSLETRKDTGHLMVIAGHEVWPPQ